MNSRRSSIILLTGIIIGGLVLFVSAIYPAIREQSPSDCTSSQKYNSYTKHCEEKTSSDIAREKEEKALDSKKKIEQQVADGKANGTICLSTSEAWKNIGKTTCVVFYPEYFYRSNEGYLFIDEKKDYKKGFVAFFGKKNMMSWNEFLNRYNIGEDIAVYGEITMYQGHPQIIVRNVNQITYPTLIHCVTSYGCVYKR